MPLLQGTQQHIRGINPRFLPQGFTEYLLVSFVAEMLGRGASGYLLKDNAFEELARAIRAVMAGQVFLSPQVAGLVASDYQQRLADGDTEIVPLLSEREREVLQLLAEGHNTKEIADQLSISAKTVETHRAQIMAKLKLDSIAALTKYAVREGLTSV